MNKLILVISLSLFTLYGYSGGIFKIIKKGNVEKLQKFFDKGGDVNEEIEFDEEFIVHPLSYAVSMEQLAIVEWFIKHKDKLDNPKHRISEAFILSISNEGNDISKLLYEQEPDINDACANCHEHNALQVAIVYGKLDWYNILKPQTDLTYLSGPGPLAAKCNKLLPSEDIFQDVLTIEGLDVNLTNNLKMTPLDFAAANEHFPFFYELLIQNGAEVSAAWNILYYASTGISEYIFTDETLEERSDDIWIADGDGNIPLDMALYWREIDEDYNEVQIYMINWLLFAMADDVKKNGLSSGFQDSFFEGKNTLADIAYISSYLNQDVEDEDEMNIAQHFLEFLGVVQEAGGDIYLFKSDYKYLKRLFGKDVVNEWYANYELDIP